MAELEQLPRLAIVGMGARLPGANDVETFWNNLVEGRESIRIFTRAELLEAGVPADLVADPEYVPAAGIPDHADGIDLALFRMNRSEAEVVDPQHRLFLECVWAALEDAGSMLPDGARRTGVFASTDLNTYLPFVIAPRLGKVGTAREFQIEIGNDKDYLATRVSYKLDLKGPSMVVQTACSSSLVAVHLACESLLSGGCDVAVAGGSRLHIPLFAGHLHQPDGVSAAEPHCRPFDANASGTLRGSGAAAVVLKRVEDALADGDRIYALVLGSAMNNDGADKVGFTAPSVRGQCEVIREALAIAGVEPEEVLYVETHGTGTVLGDPIEVEALALALDARRHDRQECSLGAVKANVGHLGSAAGVTGLIKAALALEREVIPGTPNFTTPNPELRLHETRFVIPEHATSWPRRQDVRRVAGVSSFGIGGTNCHVVLGEPPVRASREVIDGPQLLVLSAATPSALRTSALNLADHLCQHRPALEDVATTLQIGRRSLSYRTAFVARSTADAVERLEDLADRQAHKPAETPNLCMLFPGYGSEFAGMALDTMERYGSFRDDIGRCATYLREVSGIDLLSFLRSGEVGDSQSRTKVVPPVVSAVEYCLARLLMSWGIQPTAFVGYSTGEYTAAAIAGVFSLEDCLTITAQWGRAMAAMPPGAMTAIHAGEDVIGPLLSDGLSIAAVNSPDLTVVTGLDLWLEVLEERLQEAVIPFVRLRADRAFHTSEVDRFEAAFRMAFEHVRLNPPRLPCYSNRFGRALTIEECLSADYWVGLARHPARFMDCVRAVRGTGVDWFLEIGAGKTLSRFTRQTLRGGTGEQIRMTLGDTTAAECETLLATLGALWEAGAAVAWHIVDRPSGGRKVSLPTYPFERQRCWFGDRAGGIEESSEQEGTATRAAGPKSSPSVGRFEDGTVADVVSQIVAEVIGVAVSDLMLDLPFVEQGLASLALLEVAEKIRQQLGVRVTLPDLLDELCTVESLAHYLAQQGVSLPSVTESERKGTISPAESPVSVQTPVNPFGTPFSEVGLSDAQRTYIRHLVPKYVSHTAKSKAYNERYRSRHADPRNSAGFRSIWKEIVYPIVAERSSGAWVWDLDGNRYVDLTMSFGAALFGHSPPFIQDVLTEQLERGITVGPQSAGSGLVAEQIARLTGFDRTVFTNSGTEAVMVAIRLARAATRRDRIVVFRGSYHGSFDGVLARASGPDVSASAPAALGVPRSLVNDVVVLEYGSDEVLELLRREGDSIAAVIAEPVQSRNPSFQPREYLRRVRDATRGSGTLLVLDEMITGFRCHPGGVNALWEVEADVATYGKVLGGGLPIGAVSGRAEILDLIDGGSWQYGDDSRPEAHMTFFAGTFCKHPLAMSAALAVLSEIESQGPALQAELANRTTELVRDLQAEFVALDCPIEVDQFSSLFSFTPDAADGMGELFFKGLVLRGIYVWEGRTSFLSTAHSGQDVQEVLAAATDAARELLNAQVIRRVATPKHARSDGEPQETDSFPCRDEQWLLWLGMQMDAEAAAAYNEVITIPLKGSVDEGMIAEAVRQLIARNDALRIRLDPTGRRQRITPRVEFQLDVTQMPPSEDRCRRARDLVSSWRSTQFDLERGPVVRGWLLRLGADEQVLVLVAPHLIVDGWSIAVLRKQFEVMYGALLAGQVPHQDTSPKFEEFVRWERAGLAHGEKAAYAHWEERLRGVDPSPMVPGLSPNGRAYAARYLRRELARDTSKRFRSVCSSLAATPFSVGLAAWCTALAAVTDRHDVTVAVTFAGQPAIGQFDLVGYCLKVLPIRIQVERQSFAALVAAVRDAISNARTHWFIKESALIEQFWSRRDPARPPMGGVTFEFEQAEPGIELDGATPIDIDLVERRLTKWDAAMVLFEEAERLTAELRYTETVPDDIAAALIDRYVAILDLGCREPSAADLKHGSRRC